MISELIVVITVAISGYTDGHQTKEVELIDEDKGANTSDIRSDVPTEGEGGGTDGGATEGAGVNDGNSDDNLRVLSSDDSDSSGAPPSNAHSSGDLDMEEVTQLFEVTAYTAGVESTGKAPGDEGYGITASGEYVREGVTVACPPSMAFGTVVSIEGVGERVCKDRGSAITEGRLDVYMADVEDALDFGRQTLEVRIIK